MRTPGNKSIRRIWETIARIIRSIADQNATDLEPPLQDEFAQVIRSTWEKAERPETTDRSEFNKMLQSSQLQRRDHVAGPPKCCVWVGEGSVWIHQPTFEDWLSTPVAKSKRYAFGDMRDAFQLLGFVPRDLHRSVDGIRIHARVWRGPLDLLVDDETEDAES
jgi:hypothetical protein